MTPYLLSLLVACTGTPKDSADSTPVDSSTDSNGTTVTDDTATDSDTGSKEGNAKVGGDLYKSSCATCHGSDGKQGTLTNGVPAADLTVEVPALSDGELLQVMEQGYNNMPAQLVDTKPAENCLAYLRQTFGAYSGS